MNSSIITLEKHHFTNQHIGFQRGHLIEVITPDKQRLSIRYALDLNIIMIRGCSSSLDVLPAYRNLIYQSKVHLLISNKLIIYLHYEVINATTTKLIFDLFKMLKKAITTEKEISVHWIVDDGNYDLIDIGNELQHFYTNLNIAII
jgi:hypothetical protein